MTRDGAARARPILLVLLLWAGAVSEVKAAPQAAGHESAKGSTPAAAQKGEAPAAENATLESLEAVAARIKRRLEEEQRARAARPAPRAARALAAPPPRVTLVWRPTVTWPAGILDAGSGPASGVRSDRVRLSWDLLEP